jgi:uncharacterized protein (DUF1330 family)
MNPTETPNWYKEYKSFIESSIEKYLERYLAIPMSIALEDFKEVIHYGFQ